MNTENVSTLAATLTGLSKLAAGLADTGPEIEAVKTAAAAFMAVVTSALPAKANGEAYTDDELEELASANDEEALAILARHGVKL